MLFIDMLHTRVEEEACTIDARIQLHSGREKEKNGNHELETWIEVEPHRVSLDEEQDDSKSTPTICAGPSRLENPNWSTETPTTSLCDVPLPDCCLKPYVLWKWSTELSGSTYLTPSFRVHTRRSPLVSNAWIKRNKRTGAGSTKRIYISHNYN